MTIIEKYLTENDSYKNNVNKVDSRYTAFQSNGPKGIMLHSVGCAQPSAEVFFGRWNKSGVSKSVHAFIDANDGSVLNTLPWNFRGWHAGGSANDTMAGVEMCESNCIKYVSGTKFEVLDAAKAKTHAVTAYKSAVELFAMVCKKYSLNPLTAIMSHSEGYKKGVASDHDDPEGYWKGLGLSYTMDGFRQDVKAAMESSDVFQVKVNVKTTLNVRSGAGSSYKKVGCLYNGDVVSVVATKGSWYKLSSGTGWISSNYVAKIK